MSIIEKMTKEYEHMTDSEKKIYHYICANPLTVSLKSINEVSAHLDISKTTLMRFSQTLGFKGYAQFKKMLQEEHILNSSPAERMKELYESDYIMSAEKTKNSEVDNINHTLLSIDDEKFNRLISALMKKPHIYTMGWDVSSYLAEILSFRFNHLGFSCVHMKRDAIDFDVQAMHFKKGEVLILFDFFKYTKALDRAARIAKEKETLVVLITDSPACPMCVHSDLTFFCATKTDLLMNSMIGPIFFINLLVSEIIYQLDEDVIRIFNERFRILNDSGEYF